MKILLPEELSILCSQEVDNYFMLYAIELAKKGLLTTYPNPLVGAVIVHQNKVLAYGYHEKAGKNHAEINALEMLSKFGYEYLIPEATIYVTLEPCAHQGKTPSCAKKLAQLGFKRCVIGGYDPNHLVAGKGIAILEAAGIQVDRIEESIEKLANNLNYKFFSIIQKQPYVSIKIASSLDGHSALANLESKWITNHNSRTYVQMLRMSSEAIIASAKTVVVDNANYNVRYDILPEEYKHLYQEEEIVQPLVVILDDQQILNKDLNIFSNNSHKLIISSGRHHLQDANLELVNFIELDLYKQGLQSLIDLLSLNYGLYSILVETGANLTSAFVQQGCYDEIHLFYGNILMGHTSKSILELPEYNIIDECIKLKLIHNQSIQDNLYSIYKKEIN